MLLNFSPSPSALRHYPPPAMSLTPPTSPLSSSPAPSSSPPPPPPLSSSTSPPSPSRESLSDQFTRLCLEIPTPPPSPSPSLPGLTPTESAHLRLNPSSQLYLIPPPTNPPPSSFFKAYRHALAHTLSNADPSLYALLLSHPTLTPSSSQPTPPSSPPPPPPPLKYPQLRTLTWSNSLARQTLDSFTQSWRAKRAAQIAADNLEAQQALARAQSTSTPKLPKSSPPRPSTLKPRFNFTKDPVLWAAQEEAAASSVLRELRTALTKWRKGSSKAPPERSVLWTLVAQKNTKLKPEAAAEMARARVAAAAAAAVMKEGKEGGPADSLGDIDVEAVQFGVDHVRILEGGAADDDLVVCPGFPRALLLDSGRRMRNVSKKKKKKVSFVEGTMFEKGG